MLRLEKELAVLDDTILRCTSALEIVLTPEETRPGAPKKAAEECFGEELVERAEPMCSLASLLAARVNDVRVFTRRLRALMTRLQL